MTAKTPLIIDCDPGVDDAIALLLALRAPELDVLAITTVAGNVGPELTARNARIICDIAGRSDVSVYAGCKGPMVRKPVEAADFHGASGLGTLEIFEPAAPLTPGHSAQALVELVMARPAKSVTLAITGPMTNVALALLLEPKLAEHLGPVVIMGGARSEGGNITPTAEFNIFADPHAAHIVFSAGLETTVFGLDVTHTVRATAPRTAAIHALTGKVAQTVAQIFDFANKVEKELAGGDGTPMHDPCTIVWLLDPSLFTTRPCRIAVETASPVTLGCTSVDFRPPEGDKAKCRWASAADADGVFELLEKRFR